MEVDMDSVATILMEREMLMISGSLWGTSNMPFYRVGFFASATVHPQKVLPQYP